MSVPDQLRITWSAGSSFLDALDRSGVARYVATLSEGQRVTSAIGDRVTVEHEFLDTRRTFRHVAKVIAHEPGPPEKLTFEFLAEQRAVRDLIIGHAEGRSVPYVKRRAERKLVWLPVEVWVDEQARRGFVCELSELGAFVAMANPPPPDRSVQLQIRTEDGPRLEVFARIVYSHDHGPRVGFAGEFTFTTPDDQARIARGLRSVLKPAKRS